MGVESWSRRDKDSKDSTRSLRDDLSLFRMGITRERGTKLKVLVSRQVLTSEFWKGPRVKDSLFRVGENGPEVLEEVNRGRL